MHALILALAVSSLTFEYLIRDVEVLPAVCKYIPDLLALVATVMVIVVGVRDRFQYMRPVYWLVFGAFTVVLACGVVVNSVEPGPLFTGLRNYLRALPFFFLPATFALSEKQLRTQLLLILALACAQLPLAVQQRIATAAAHATTGDWTYGSLMGPSEMTLFLLPCAAVVTAFFLRKRISMTTFVVLLAITLAPTMLNESKAALLLAPIVLLTVFLVGSQRGTRLKNFLVAVGAVACFIAVFIPVYDSLLSEERQKEGIVNFFLTDGRVENYLDRGHEVGSQANPGKLGELRNAFTLIADDPITLVFGVGMGNVSDSALGEQFKGDYFALYGHLVSSALPTMISELGLLGLGLLCLLYWVIFRDCVRVARIDTGIYGALALGWTGAAVALFIGLAQTFPIANPALSMLFWYFTGIVAAQRSRQEAVDLHSRRLTRSTYYTAVPSSSPPGAAT